MRIIRFGVWAVVIVFVVGWLQQNGYWQPLMHGFNGLLKH